MIFIGVILIFILFSIAGSKQGVPVLLFHEVNNESGTNPDLFEKYMEYIYKNKM